MELLRRSSCCFFQHHIKKLNLVHIRTISINKKKKVTDCELALESFDVTYGTVYGAQWPSIRLGLLCQKKYVAIINNYSPNYIENMKKFKELGCMDVGERYRAYCDEMNSKDTNNMESDLNDESSSSIRFKKNKQSDKIPKKEMSDDQLSKVASAPPPDRYPERYRAITGTQDEAPSSDDRLTIPGVDRLLLPQPGVQHEVPTLHDYVPSKSLKGLDTVSEEQDMYEQYRQETESGIGPATEVCEASVLLQWPEMLSVMAFSQSDITLFPQPSYDHGVSDHFAMDGGSLLPVLVLGVQSGDSVLDMCAGPGGKTLLMLQTCFTGLLQSNDISLSRARRVESIVKQFYGSDDCSLLAKHRVTHDDGRALEQSTHDCFDRVLVDVPCLTDRHSLNEPDNNIFKKGRLKDRLAMPEIQAELLLEALKQVRVGGTVVYSTCTLSPLQNDGVVHLALNRLWDYTNIECRVELHNDVLEPFKFMFKFGEADLGLRYGQVVLPWLPNNYGPTYFAKLVRTK